MADAPSTRSQRATAGFFPPESTSPIQTPEPHDAIAVTRAFQSAVFRLRWTILAMKSAANGEHEDPGQKLFWPDLMDALAVLTPDADALDIVVDELRRA